MARHGLIMLALTFFLVIDSFADASLVLNFRKAILEPNSSAANLTQNSPIPNPVPGGKDSNSTAAKLEKDKDLNSNTTKHEKEKDFNSTAVTHEKKKDFNSTVVKQEKEKDFNSTEAKHEKEKPTDPGVTKNNTSSTKSVPTDKQTDTGQTHEGEEKRSSTVDSQLGSVGSCAGLTKSCNILNTMVACILPSEPGSKQLSILVQSLSQRTLKVNFVGNALRPFEIPSHQTKQMNISLADVKANTIVLHAENGDCAIHMAAPPGKNYFKELSFYSKQVTPIYGAYFSFLVVLVCGGVWACCKLRKRRWQGGVPYQELEMGLPESAAAAAVVNVDSTEGWDQGWDSDWDDDKAVMSSGGNHVGSISANGLTSRSAKKDGWEVDWED